MILYFLLLLVSSGDSVYAQSQTERFLVPTGRIVFAKKNIRAGELFTRSNLEMRLTTQDKIPPDSFTRMEALFERRAGYRIRKNQIVSTFEIKPIDRLSWTSYDESSEREILKQKPRAGYGLVVYAMRDIPAGWPVEPMILDAKQIELSKIPKDAVTSAKKATGRIAKYGISQGQILTEHDLLPRKNRRLKGRS